jgi:hypothetical protein
MESVPEAKAQLGAVQHSVTAQGHRIKSPQSGFKISKPTSSALPRPRERRLQSNTLYLRKACGRNVFRNGLFYLYNEAIRSMASRTTARPLQAPLFRLHVLIVFISLQIFRNTSQCRGNRPLPYPRSFTHRFAHSVAQSVSRLLAFWPASARPPALARTIARQFLPMRRSDAAVCRCGADAARERQLRHHRSQGTGAWASSAASPPRAQT